MPQFTYATSTEKLPDEYIECRQMRHAFAYADDFYLVEKHNHLARVVARRLFCDRCGMVANDTYTVIRRRGHELLQRLGTRRYLPPPGYYLRFPDGAPAGLTTQELVSAELWRRVKERTGIEL